MASTLLFKNRATTILASAITAIQTTITVNTGTGTLFPNPGAGQAFLGTLQSATNPNVFEIVLVTARSNDILTVTRAQEGTTGTAFNASDIFALLPTAGTAAAFAQGTPTNNTGSLPTIRTFAGNPNSNVAGNQQDFVWDTTHLILWECVTTGTASTAVWDCVSNNTLFNVLDNGSGSATFVGTVSLTNGQLNVGSNTVSGVVSVNGPAASLRELVYRTAGNLRWNVYADNTAESGSNAGSNFIITGYNDAGTAIATYLSINRATGAVTTLNNTLDDGFGDAIFGTNTAAGVFVDANAAAGNAKQFRFKTAGNKRWILNSDSSSESGSNAGSNFEIQAFADAGTFLFAPISIIRSTGEVFGSSATPSGVTGVSGLMTVMLTTPVSIGTLTLTGSNQTVNIGTSYPNAKIAILVITTNATVADGTTASAVVGFAASGTPPFNQVNFKWTGSAAGSTWNGSITIFVPLTPGANPSFTYNGSGGAGASAELVGFIQ